MKIYTIGFTQASARDFFTRLKDAGATTPVDVRLNNTFETLDRELLDGGCLLCSEAKPHHCHRRLVAEYLQRH